MKNRFINKMLAMLAVLSGLGVGAWAAIAKVNDETAASTPKFHVDVTGYAPAGESGTRTPVAVNADVYGDYHFVVTMPDSVSSTVGADKATVNVRMTGVQTLGMKAGETRSYSKTVETGVSGVNASLATALSNVYAFKGATIPVTIKDGTKTASFNYVIGAFGNNQIVGTPSSEATARTAWHMIADNVAASQNLSQNDTHFLFKRGAYVLLGDEKLVFDQDYDFLKGNADLKTLFSDVRPYVHVEKSGLSGQAANKAVIYMPEGSTLGISSSAAVLNKDAFLTVDATAQSDMNITGALSGLRDELAKSGDASTKVAIAFAVGMVNQIVGMVDEAESVPVTLEFKKNKFHLDVTGYSSDTEAAVPVTVNADVYSDYTFDVALPAAGSDQLTASKATVNLRMTDVSTLGVSGTRSYSKTLETGVSGVTTNLSVSLKNTYAFQGVSCPVTIKDEAGSKQFTYNIAGIKDNHIVGTPSSSTDAQAAWHLMTSHVKASQDLSQNDTHFLFKKGAYVQLGDEKLVFDTDFDFMKGAASLDDLFNDIRPAVHVEKDSLKGAALKTASVYLPAGSTLGVSSSSATVDQNVTVTMDASQSQADESNFKGLLSGYRDKVYSNGSANKRTAIALLVYYFDQVVGLADNAETVPFTVEFSKPKIYVDNDSKDKTVEFGDVAVGDSTTQTFVLSGAYLNDDVTLTYDGDHAFTVSLLSVPQSEAMAQGGKLVSVTFRPTSQQGGTYTGTVTLTSNGADTLVVNLSATVPADGIWVTIGDKGVTTLYYDHDLVIPFDTYDGLLSVSFVKSTDDDVARMSALRQYIPANTGVVIIGNSGRYFFPTKHNEDKLPDVSGNLLKGSTRGLATETAKEQYKADIYTLQSNGESFFVFKRYTDQNLSANKAFLPYTLTNNAKGLTLVWDDATGINGVNMNAAQDGLWYNLGGARFNQRPAQRGVYIHNGKKVVIK